MPLDGYTMKCLAAELKNKLINGRIEKIYQPRSDTLLLHLRTLKGREILLLSANPSNPRLHLTRERNLNNEHPPMLCMLLRKYLGGGTIASITQQGMDRVLEFGIVVINQLGGRVKRRLVCEMMGRHSNIILLEQDGIVIDSIKRVTAQMSSYRHIFPGIEYKLPPSQFKLDISAARDEELKNALMAHTGTGAVKAVSAAFEGIGKVMARELCARGNIEPDDTLKEALVPGLAHAASRLADILKNEDFCPTIYYKNSDVLDFSPIFLTHLGLACKIKPNINTMLDDFFFEKTKAETFKREREHLLKTVENLKEKNLKKLGNRMQELQNAATKEDYRLYGELIIANLHRLKEKVGSVSLEDYTKPGLPVVKIKLDPKITPLQNSNYFFKEYSRAKRTVQNLKKLIRQSEREITYLESIIYSIESCTQTDGLREIRLELEKGKYLRPAKTAKQEKSVPGTGFFIYRTGDGFTVYVGRNNRQNDYLTQRFARKDDLWLHTKDIPGSHVLIRSEGRKIPRDTLLQGALLAAYHSKARQSGSVPVDYTLVKHVSKPTGAKPGFVIYKNQKTVFVTPERNKIDSIEKLEK